VGARRGRRCAGGLEAGPQGRREEAGAEAAGEAKSSAQLRLRAAALLPGGPLPLFLFQLLPAVAVAFASAAAEAEQEEEASLLLLLVLLRPEARAAAEGERGLRGEEEEEEEEEQRVRRRRPLPPPPLPPAASAALPLSSLALSPSSSRRPSGARPWLRAPFWPASSVEAWRHLRRKAAAARSCETGERREEGKGEMEVRLVFRSHDADPFFLPFFLLVLFSEAEAAAR